MSLRNMAVIEEVPLEDKKQETTQNSTPEKPKSSSESTTNSGDTIASASTASGSANVRENDSDGFETASERDVSDNDEDNQEGQQHCDSVVNDEEAKQTHMPFKPSCMLLETDMKKILELDPSNDFARPSIIRLEPLAAEKREKMKEEMIGKLKEMGNSLLGRFGMSVDNFKAVKDPNTGSYSISFQN
ncbi:Tetratricopeptide repeat protein 1 [Linum perenne]